MINKDIKTVGVVAFFYGWIPLVVVIRLLLTKGLAYEPFAAGMVAFFSLFAIPICLACISLVVRKREVLDVFDKILFLTSSIIIISVLAEYLLLFVWI
jgi:hypothetical protein